MRSRLTTAFLAVLSVALLPLVVACSSKDDPEPTPTTAASSPSATVARSATTAPRASAVASSTPPSLGGAATPTVTPASAIGKVVPPFPERRADGQTQQDKCGDFTVTRADTLGPQGVPTASSVKVTTAANVEVFAAETATAGSRVGVDWCFDITGEGAPELSVFSYSGGAHCCIEQQVITLLPTGSNPIVTYPAGNSGPLQPRDLDGKMPLELTGLDDRFVYFHGLPYVASPFVGVIYGERGGEWIDITAEPESRQVISQYRDQLVSQLANCNGVQPELVEICQQGLMTGVMVESLVLGDWDAFQFKVTIPDAVRTWLNGVRPEAEALMKTPK